MNDGLPYTDRKGIKAGNCRTTEEKIREVCQYLQDRPEVSATVVARMFGVNYRITAALVKGHNWTHVTEEYDFSKRHKYNLKWGPKTRRQTTT